MPGLNKLFSLFFVLSLLWGVSAFASDGVLEINHACAINGGCFSGDNAGYPITIDGNAGASYRLTSNLIVPNENTHGMRVDTSSISIDLNGFEIVRSGCEGTKVSCMPETGTGVGILIAFDTFGASVSNGSITGMGSHGADLGGNQSEAKDLRVRWNRQYGIRSGNGSTISDNTAYNNGLQGIRAGQGSTISGNTVFENGAKGEPPGAGGIQALGGCMIQGNTVRDNVGFGLSLTATDAYRENVMSGNTSGAVVGGFNMGDNFCTTNDTCP